jgi:hypothetical protein
MSFIKELEISKLTGQTVTSSQWNSPVINDSGQVYYFGVYTSSVNNNDVAELLPKDFKTASFALYNDGFEMMSSKQIDTFATLTDWLAL